MQRISRVLYPISTIVDSETGFPVSVDIFPGAFIIGVTRFGLLRNSLQILGLISLVQSNYTNSIVFGFDLNISNHSVSC